MYRYIAVFPTSVFMRLDPHIHNFRVSLSVLFRIRVHAWSGRSRLRRMQSGSVGHQILGRPTAQPRTACTRGRLFVLHVFVFLFFFHPLKFALGHRASGITLHMYVRVSGHFICRKGVIRRHETCFLCYNIEGVGQRRYRKHCIFRM